MDRGARLIERARSRDLPALHGLARRAAASRRAAGEPPPLAFDASAIDRAAAQDTLWVVRVQGRPEPLAFAAASFVDGVVHLEAVDVDPDAPAPPDNGGADHAVALVEAVCAWAVTTGAAAVTASVSTPSAGRWAHAGLRPLSIHGAAPHLAAQIAHERAHGLTDRIAVERVLIDEVEAPLRAHLEALGIEYRVVRHAPVRTVPEAQVITGHLPGVHVKNLFLRDKKRRFWLLTTLDEAVVDLRALRGPLGARGTLSFASPDHLRDVLRIQPGAVTPVAVMHDVERAVSAILDGAVLDGPLVHCHPLHNRATMALSPRDLVRFMTATGHEPTVLPL